MIDEDYRGEICVILINLGDRALVVNKHDRVAQLVLERADQFIVVETETLPETARGAGGYGSTGR